MRVDLGKKSAQKAKMFLCRKKAADFFEKSQKSS